METIYQTLKTKYGVQACHLLHINSRSPTASNAGSNDTVNMPNPWSRFITQKQEMSVCAILCSNTLTYSSPSHAGLHFRQHSFSICLCLSHNIPKHLKLSDVFRSILPWFSSFPFPLALSSLSVRTTCPLQFT